MNSETFLLLLRLALSLSLVFGVMWVAAKAMRGRQGLMKRNSQDTLEILERKSLTKNTSIAIVRIADQTVAIGITDSNITLLTPEPFEVPELAIDVESVTAIELPMAGVAAGPVPDAPRATNFIDTLRDLTVRHQPSLGR